MSYNRDMPTGNCQKCINTFGTLGCCDTISNEWRYNCDDGMRYFDERKPLTNADRIRSMSDEELAQWICCHITECARCEGRRYDGQECEFRNGRSTGLLRWLKSPVEDEV